MASSLIRKLLAAWEKISPREKRLAKLTFAVIVIMSAFTLYQRAMTRLDDLDLTIARLEDDLVSYTYQIAHRELVESQYAEIASQHSSEWSEAEIHDRLRQEIYRLASRTPAPLDENGIPVPSPNDQGNLVEGISLGKGNMAEGGRGYREYRINVRIPASPLENLILYLENLQDSPQSLRIDAAELSRSPDSNLVSASVDITRIVADGSTEKPAGESAESAATGLGRIRLQADNWKVQGARATNAAAESAYGAIELQAEEDTAEISLATELPGGTVYEMIVDMAAAQGEVSLGIGMESETEPFPGTEQVKNDGRLYRYQIQFTLPGTADKPERIKCPLIRMQGKGAAAHLANLLIRKVAEV